MPEEYRLSADQAARLRIPVELATDESAGRNGMFFIPCGREILRCMVSDGSGAEECGLAPWEHVSISLASRCPTWAEMCFVKDIFWADDECVVQFHPPKADYVNNHPYCLHLWRPVNTTFPRPPSIMVGLR